MRSRRGCHRGTELRGAPRRPATPCSPWGRGQSASPVRVSQMEVPLLRSGSSVHSILAFDPARCSPRIRFRAPERASRRTPQPTTERSRAKTSRARTTGTAGPSCAAHAPGAAGASRPWWRTRSIGACVVDLPRDCVRRARSSCLPPHQRLFSSTDGAGAASRHLAQSSKPSPKITTGNTSKLTWAGSQSESASQSW